MVKHTFKGCKTVIPVFVSSMLLTLRHGCLSTISYKLQPTALILSPKQTTGREEATPQSFMLLFWLNIQCIVYFGLIMQQSQSRLYHYYYYSYPFKCTVRYLFFGTVALLSLSCFSQSVFPRKPGIHKEVCVYTTPNHAVFQQHGLTQSVLMCECTCGYIRQNSAKTSLTVVFPLA